MEIKYENQKDINRVLEESQTYFTNKEFLSAYELLKHVTVAPTHTPKNFFEQFVFFDDSTNRRLYIYINNTWRYVALT